ncbi:BPTD_3080 family restriction endonuclease [Lyngbya sp. CCY1209]|uniref:BPTD_3080 family restriction endonuclease n=1 Tax=Lyngbya sp. CCY1209 TaxID=2886103 RepID=UPI002D20B959|nr:DEAD/DEAH box helicase family protein [Lyngbya sp. CCY1209]MEB3885784.1 DEAD/DEAH box helicase family protein [Lyngbya sp. CCY1209]
MVSQFFEQPILNSPYECPQYHWELDDDGQPTGKKIRSRRRAEFLTPIPKPKRRRDQNLGVQQSLALGDVQGISDESQTYAQTLFVNSIREKVNAWRSLPNSRDWKVTPETARLLQHWRHHDFQGIRPFFCQLEAVETAIWLAEVAPNSGKQEKGFLSQLFAANEDANPELFRIALKLATGAGKTTVMAMLIAWQTVNAVRHPQSKKFTRGFLIVTPGITIRDRLRVLKPNDTESYYASRELIPTDMLPELQKAKIVITNYHAFKLRERQAIATGTRKLLQGRGPELDTLETEGQMLQRVMPELMGLKNILVLNDEAHHCYREKPDTDDVADFKGDEKNEAKKNNEAARLWISGIEMVKRKLGVQTIYDLSATPFFLRGSGYAEGTLFPWTVSDFSLMDAIECGIVKLPRVPVADNVPGGEMPKFRNLWEHIRKKMPKKGRGKASSLDPLSLPPELLTALDALYGHYEQTFKLWQGQGIDVPPVFIVVCNNTSTSKLVYDYISGFHREDGQYNAGRLELFRNFDDSGDRLPRPRTLLIDSEQLESGDALDQNFRDVAADEIDRFRYEVSQRDGAAAVEKITDQDLLREVMNTVGKAGKLGESIRCVVSVSMLTEGWDTNTVTHVLGVRAFGTQLLCEQVIGRALRRQSYEVNENGFFNVEYADVLGIPFDFTAKPVVAKPQPPAKTIQVYAVSPDRDHLEITFPRVEGYRVELPSTRLEAEFGEDSLLELTPNLVGATVTRNEGIIGEGINLDIKHLEKMREATVIFNLTRHLLFNQYRDPGEEPKLHLFGQLKRITRQWMRDYLRCTGNTVPGQLIYQAIADMACERIRKGITEAIVGEKPVKAILDAYNPVGSTIHVQFNTSKQSRWQTDPRFCHINWVILDSDWESECCRVMESHDRVLAYVKNHNLGFEVPYLYGSTPRKYIPDFIVKIDDDRGDDDLLNLIVEIKGFRGEDAKDKASTMRNYWIPGVNNLKIYGRWAFAEFREVFQIESEFAKLVDEAIQAQRIRGDGGTTA